MCACAALCHAGGSSKAMAGVSVAVSNAIARAQSKLAAAAARKGGVEAVPKGRGS